MAPSAIAQRRTHNLLLFQKLLNLRDGAGPFTLLLDTLEQSAKPVVGEFITRAKISKLKVIFVSFQTIRKPSDTDVFIRARGMELGALRKEMTSHLEAAPTGIAGPGNKVLIIFDTLNPLASTSSAQLPTFLSSFLSPQVSLLATYHTDVPIPSSQTQSSIYAPEPLTTFLYLATSVLKISDLSHEIEKKKARDRSLEEPGFGIGESREGVLVGLKNLKVDGVVIETEIRRKSGRGVKEVFVLTPFLSPLNEPGKGASVGRLSTVCLLEDHPLYQPVELGSGDGTENNSEDTETTFSLSLTEKQRRDRDGVVLPYFDAQGESGGGQGGRILYEMGREDDWDEEEDEI